MKFWALWIVALIVSTVVVFFFLAGLSDGSVSSFNAGIWTVLLLIVGVVMGGSLWLKKAGHPVLGLLLTLVLAVPGFLLTLFTVLMIIAKPRWN